MEDSILTLALLLNSECTRKIAGPLTADFSLTLFYHCFLTNVHGGSWLKIGGRWPLGQGTVVMYESHSEEETLTKSKCSVHYLFLNLGAIPSSAQGLLLA